MNIDLPYLIAHNREISVIETVIDGTWQTVDYLSPFKVVKRIETTDPILDLIRWDYINLEKLTWAQEQNLDFYLHLTKYFSKRQNKKNITHIFQGQDIRMVFDDKEERAFFLLRWAGTKNEDV